MSLKEVYTMKKFLLMLLSVNLILAAVCYATTSTAETCDVQQQICTLSQEAQGDC